jgi:hypothetical protein
VDPPNPPTAEERRERVAALVRAITAAGAEIAFMGLFAYIIHETWAAPSGHPPSISGPVAASAAALAVALAAGYASALGVQISSKTTALQFFTKGHFWSAESFILLGALVYMVIGAACGLTYLANVHETPTILKTVSIAFGGYVIAYLGTAYRQSS